MGADIVLLTPGEIAVRFPWIATEGLAAGAFGRSGEGWIDPVLLMTMLQKAATAMGVRVLHETVTGLERAGGRITGAVLAGGQRISCGSLVNAAGYGAGALAAMAGIRLPVEPRKRQVFVIDSRRVEPAMHKGPLTIDTTGVWVRPEGRLFLAGISPGEDDEPPAVDLDSIDHNEFENVVWPQLAARIPAFEEAKMTSAWAGFYDYNTLDQNGIIGAHPEVGNLYFANGFSGHGLQQGYAVGRAVAELITQGRFVSIDLTRFGYQRIDAGKPLFELNVI
jgi:glycine/D-amino acid oxidase-like deaminating enzyme